MKIKLIYYVGNKVTDIEISIIEITDNESMQWIESDYLYRLNNASESDKKSIKRRSIDEIVDEINKNEKNSWQKKHRHCILDPVNDEGQAILDNISDPNAMSPEDYSIKENYKDILKANLKPNYYDVINCILLNNVSYKDYANSRNITESNARQLYHRAIIALKNIKDKII